MLTTTTPLHWESRYSETFLEDITVYLYNEIQLEHQGYQEMNR